MPLAGRKLRPEDHFPPWPPVLFWFPSGQPIAVAESRSLKEASRGYQPRNTQNRDSRLSGSIGIRLFRSHSGGLEGLPVITWDTERFPDYRMFLEVASKTGQKLILFASREFDDAEIEEALEELEDADLTRDEQRDYERRIRSARSHVGSACSLEIAFDFNSHLYVYEARPDWYEDFLEACDEITSLLPVTDDGESGPDGLGGFYSNN